MNIEGIVRAKLIYNLFCSHYRIKYFAIILYLHDWFHETKPLNGIGFSYYYQSCCDSHWKSRLSDSQLLEVFEWLTCRWSIEWSPERWSSPELQLRTRTWRRSWKSWVQIEVPTWCNRFTKHTNVVTQLTSEITGCSTESDDIIIGMWNILFTAINI